MTEWNGLCTTEKSTHHHGPNAKTPGLNDAAGQTILDLQDKEISSRTLGKCSLEGNIEASRITYTMS